jgi:hypothetical protein
VLRTQCNSGPRSFPEVSNMSIPRFPMYFEYRHSTRQSIPKWINAEGGYAVTSRRKQQVCFKYWAKGNAGCSASQVRLIMGVVGTGGHAPLITGSRPAGHATSWSKYNMIYLAMSHVPCRMVNAWRTRMNASTHGTAIVSQRISWPVCSNEPWGQRSFILIR